MMRPMECPACLHQRGLFHYEGRWRCDCGWIATLPWWRNAIDIAMIALLFVILTWGFFR